MKIFALKAANGSKPKEERGRGPGLRNGRQRFLGDRKSLRSNTRCKVQWTRQGNERETENGETGIRPGHVKGNGCARRIELTEGKGIYLPLGSLKIDSLAAVQRTQFSNARHM